MKLTKLHLALALAAGMFATSAIAAPGGHSPTDFPGRITTKEEAMKCCLPKVKVAMACKDCKTLDVKDGEKDKKGIMAWFATDSKHGCSGCGGTLTFNYTGGGKGPTPLQSKHICSKCGPNSAYVCTDHKKS